jgi:hypothetical protein
LGENLRGKENEKLTFMGWLQLRTLFGVRMGFFELEDTVVAPVCQSVLIGFCALTGKTMSLYHLDREI